MAVLAIGLVGGLAASSVGLSFGLGFAVFGTIAEMLMQPHPKDPSFTAMSSCWGQTWPLIYNDFRVSAKIIQTSDVTKHSTKSKKGGPTFSQTFAAGGCEGSRAIVRIWADHQVIYDARPITAPDAWAAGTVYGAGDVVLPTAGGSVQFIASVDGTSGVSEPAWNSSVDSITRDGSEVWVAAKYVPRTTVGKQFDFTMRIYQGDEDQLADAALEEIVGTGLQPAYRGLAYAVFEDFNISKFGNRVPNLELEFSGTQDASFVVGADLYGTAFGSNGPFLPFLVDDAGNYYNVGLRKFANIKTLAITSYSNADLDAAAATFGMGAPSSSWLTLPLAGKYFMALGTTLSDLQMLLFGINTDGTATALGARSYGFVFGTDSLPTALASGINSATGEVMIAYGDFASVSPHVMLLDTIQNMIGGYLARPRGTRIQQIAEITGDYGAEPSPYLGYCMAFVGDILYFSLNKAIMDWHAAHSSGVGFNSYYKSLQPVHPNGTLVRVDILSDGVGGLAYNFLGPVSDFGFPFADEGKNKAGGVGQTLVTTRDVWSPPLAVQETNGVITGVWFARGYSDAANQVGIKQFVNGTFTQGADGVPFDGSFSFSLDEPSAMVMPDGSVYLTFNSGGEYYAKLGAFEGVLMTLADICADVSGRVGLTAANYDYSLLVPVVPRGVALLDRGTARSFLESLQPAFFYDLVEIGSKIVGSLRTSTASAATIPEDDLGATADMATIADRIQSTRNDDLEIPQDLSLSYYDYNHDYQQGSQGSRRNQVTNYSSGRNTINVPVVMTPAEAATAAERNLYLLWAERTPRKISLSQRYINLTPADIIVAQRGGRNYVMRVTKATLNPNLVIDIEAVSEDTGVYSITVPAPVASETAGAFGQQTINPIVQPVMAVLDTATLRVGDTVPGVYVAAVASTFGGGWDGVSVQESQDASVYGTEATLTVEATVGTTTGAALGDCPAWPIFDDVNSVEVVLLFGALANASRDDLVANLSNLAWLSNGEVFQFAIAELIATNTYRLSGLLRGRFGTESFVGTHGLAETFVLLVEETMQTVEYSPSEIGATRYWRALNDAPTNPSSVVQTVNMVTRRLLPFAPYFIRGSRNMAHDITITGLRRMRYRGRPLWSPPETDLPATVEIDILSGLTVVRTLSSSLSPNGSGITDASHFTAVYKVADQILDFGSAQASVSVRAYSLNATVGRGYPGSKTV